MDQWKQELAENLDQYQIGLEDKFQFKCRGCGKCCKNREDIILTTRDLHNIARKLGLTIEAVIEKYCDTYIGGTSRIPIVRLQPAGATRNCPLLSDKRCLVHDAKPAVCALYPLGRAVMRKKDSAAGLSEDTGVVYFMQPIECGSRNRSYTIKSWLEKFGIPLDDEFYVLWTETVMFLSEFFRDLEEKKVPDYALEMLWTLTFGALYAAYDTGVDLMPQFRENAAKLKRLLSGVEADTTQLEALKEHTGGEDVG